MKIYTRTGDNGKTSLLSGKRVDKHDKRIVAYGSVDELNSLMGIVRDFSPKKYKNEIFEIQNKLMIIASQLSKRQTLVKGILSFLKMQSTE